MHSPSASTGPTTTPTSTYSRVQRNAYGQPTSHLASYSALYYGSPYTTTLSDTPFTWDSDRLATRGESDTSWNYSYDDKGQVSGAHKKFTSGEVLAGSQSVYAYDDIGNRTQLQEGGGNALGSGLRSTTYSADLLNQYTAISRPQTFDVTGKRTSSAATVKVNDVTLGSGDFQPGSNGLYFRNLVENTPAPVPAGDIYEPVDVTQQISTGPVVSLTDDPVQAVPPSVTNSPPRYDLDGNLLSDGRWTYTWDGENRLVRMESAAWIQPTTPPGATKPAYAPGRSLPAVTLTFEYDGLSRRASKRTVKMTGSTVDSDTREGYLYDGWNVVMISNLDPTTGAHLLRKWSCVWRPDVGSSLYARSSWQKAGGVGGLAWLQTGATQTVYVGGYNGSTPILYGTGEVHIPLMDHMGNVRHYYQIKTTPGGYSESAVSGQLVASLEYDAFGREVRATGTNVPASGNPPGIAASTTNLANPWVDNLPFHFSTKFTDRESGLNYYGFRFYDPLDGRWINRDPIGEEGGQNLYAIVGNASIGRVDVLGLVPPYFWPIPPRGPVPDSSNRSVNRPKVYWSAEACPEPDFETRYIQVVLGYKSGKEPPFFAWHSYPNGAVDSPEGPKTTLNGESPFYGSGYDEDTGCGRFTDAEGISYDLDFKDEPHGFIGDPNFEVCRACVCKKTGVATVGPCVKWNFGDAKANVDDRGRYNLDTLPKGDPSKKFEDILATAGLPGTRKIPGPPPIHK